MSRSKDKTISYASFVLVVVMGCVLLLCSSGCDKRAKRSKKSSKPVAAQEAPAPKKIQDIDLAKSLMMPIVQDVRLKRNFFRPLVGPESLAEELARTNPQAASAIPGSITPQSLKLTLKGVVMGENKIAYVASPEDDFVLRVGDAVSTMRVQEIRSGAVVFVLDDGQISILSNDKEE